MRSTVIVRGPWHLVPLGKRFAVQYLEDEAMRFGPWTSREHALHFCNRLNRRWITPRRAAPALAGAPQGSAKR